MSTNSKKGGKTGLRTLTAVVALAVIAVPCAIWGQYGLEVVGLIAAIIGLDEHAIMINKRSAGGEPYMKHPKLLRLLEVIGGGSLYAAFMWDQNFLMMALGTVFGIAVVIGLSDKRSNEENERLIMRMTFGMLYIPIAIACCIMFGRLDNGPAWILVIMLLSWGTDIGGYFAGRKWGRKKVHESISPGKHWEGVYGGVALAVVSTSVVKYFFIPDWGWIDWIFFSVGLSWLSVKGDLIMSLIKRTHSVKDSGWILPGHGGMLDRIDAFMFVGLLGQVFYTGILYGRF